MKPDKRNWGILTLITCVALLLRISLFNFKSLDYVLALHNWIEFIKSHGGFAALKYSFADYNSLYLYLLAMITYIPVSDLYSIKFISIIFDFFSAWIVYFIVKMKYPLSQTPLYAYSAVLFFPTIVVNSALWAQSDMTYTFAVLVSLYFLIKKGNFWAMFFYGLAFSFKLQAIFILPLYLVLVARRKINFKHLLVIPAVYIISIIPNWLLGRPFSELLSIYAAQAQNYEQLTLNAPTMYTWFPQTHFVRMKYLGLLFAFVTNGFLMLHFWRSKDQWNEWLIKMAMVFSIYVPFVLPKMHERYFFLADVLSIVYAFYFPRYFYLPIIVGAVSLTSYCTFLFLVNNIPIRFLTIIMLFAIGIVFSKCLDIKSSFFKNVFAKQH